MIQEPSNSQTAAFAMVRGHHILTAAVGPRSVVLDIGANHGEFAREIQRRFGCSSILVEANPHLCAELAHSSGFPLLHAAVAGRSATLAFNLALNDEGSSIRALPEASPFGCVHVATVQVPAKTLADVCAYFHLAKIDLLKMDIEGAEIEVLESCPAEVLKRISQLTVEFHCAEVFGFGGREAVTAVIRRLKSLGFTAYVFDPDFTDVLFVQHAPLGTSFWKRALLHLRLSRPRWLSSLWCLVPSGIRGFVRLRMGATKE